MKLHVYKSERFNGRKKSAHILIAEKVLGKPLPDGAIVHHANENKHDNRKANLVICPNRAYHNLIHARLSAFKATGNPAKRKCPICKEWDDVSNFVYAKTRTHGGWHLECMRKYCRDRWRKINWTEKKL